MNMFYQIMNDNICQDNASLEEASSLVTNMITFYYKLGTLIMIHYYQNHKLHYSCGAQFMKTHQLSSLNKPRIGWRKNAQHGLNEKKKTLYQLAKEGAKKYSTTYNMLSLLDGVNINYFLLFIMIVVEWDFVKIKDGPRDEFSDNLLVSCIKKMGIIIEKSFLCF